MKFQPIGFLTSDFFAGFVPKLAQAFILTILSSKILWLNEKIENTLFPVVKLSTPTNFASLPSILTAETSERRENSEGK